MEKAVGILVAAYTSSDPAESCLGSSSLAIGKFRVPFELRQGTFT